MASPGHPAYAGSASYRKNFDRDVHADTGIFNRLKATTLTVTGSMTVVGNACFPNGSAAAPGIAFCTEATGYYIDNTDTLYTTITGSHILNIQKDAGNATIEAAQTRAMTIKSFDNAGGLSTVAQLFSGDAANSGWVNVATGDGTASSGTVNISSGNAGTVALAGNIRLNLGDDGGGAANTNSYILMRGTGSSAVHLITSQTTAPAIAGGGGAVAISPTSNDTCGSISNIAWNVAQGNNTVTVTFNRRWDPGSVAPIVLLTAANQAAIDAAPFVSSVSNTGFVLDHSVNIGGMTNSNLFYMVIGVDF